MLNFSPMLNKSVVEFTHDLFQVGTCCLWTPEAISTARGLAGVYPSGMSWQRDGDELVKRRILTKSLVPATSMR